MFKKAAKFKRLCSVDAVCNSFNQTVTQLSPLDKIVVFIRVSLKGYALCMIVVKKESAETAGSHNKGNTTGNNPRFITHANHVGRLELSTG